MVMDFLLFFCVFPATDSSPRFAQIKNPFWIIRSLLNPAAARLHNKFNLAPTR